MQAVPLLLIVLPEIGGFLLAQLRQVEDVEGVIEGYIAQSGNAEGTGQVRQCCAKPEKSGLL